MRTMCMEYVSHMLQHRLPIIPIAAGTGGILFPECNQKICVSGEELCVVRSIEGEQLPLFGYCTVDKDGGLMPVGTMALMEKVEWSQLTPEEGGPPEVEGKPWTPWGGSDLDSKAIVRCVGVQRFQIVALEAREPYPIARVQLFTDETEEHKEPELDEARLCYVYVCVRRVCLQRICRKWRTKPARPSLTSH